MSSPRFNKTAGIKISFLPKKTLPDKWLLHLALIRIGGMNIAEI
ncbi:MAG: hypothetical protein N2246_05535 [Candidatus Sumerlaeia bacterium]|nr:hypothetical protein [Candidatus Sumerlaeia bacterium]